MKPKMTSDFQNRYYYLVMNVTTTENYISKLTN